MSEKLEGIVSPSIDKLMDRVDSKYELVMFAAKRARQINDYYSALHEGSLFSNVGPLVDVTIDEKPSTDTRTSDRLYLNRDTQTRELSVSLANRNRFCNKPLWVDIDAEIKSRENTSDSTRLPKPTHENKHKKVFRRAPERANRPGEDKKRLVLRESMRFMASSPVTQEDSKECTQQDGRQLERASIFMTSSSK